jgi:hypothetical protein
VTYRYHVSGGGDRWTLVIGDAAGERALGRATYRHDDGRWVAWDPAGVWAGEYPTRAAAFRALAALAGTPTEGDFRFGD